VVRKAKKRGADVEKGGKEGEDRKRQEWRGRFASLALGKWMHLKAPKCGVGHRCPSRV